jgi:hypothetical protein
MYGAVAGGAELRTDVVNYGCHYGCHGVAVWVPVQVQVHVAVWNASVECQHGVPVQCRC